MDVKGSHLGALLPAQNMILDAILRIRREMDEEKRTRGRISIVVLKARKMGVSTLIQGLLFRLICRLPTCEAIVIAHKLESAQYLYGISERFYRRLPNNRRPARRFSNRRGLTFDEPLDSSLYVDVIGEAAGRSRTVHAAHFSELAQWGDTAYDTLSACRDAMANEPWCLEVVESTGFGLGGAFYEEYLRAKKDGRALFFPWWMDPRYRSTPGLSLEDADPFIQEQAKRYPLDPFQVAWANNKFLNEKGSDERLFRQEYPGCEDDAFQGQSRSVFEISLIKKLQDQVRDAKEDSAKFSFDIGLPKEVAPGLNLIHRLDEPGGPDSDYVIGADPAEGLETGDSSALIVLDRVRGIVVAYAETILDVDSFAELLKSVSRYYNDAWLVVERNNHGHAVISRLRAEGFSKLWRQRRAWNQKSRPDGTFGFQTSQASKSTAVGSVIARIRDDMIFVPFQPLVEQIKTFVYDERGKMGALPGCHDDLVSALWLACAAAEDLGVTDPVSLKKRELENPASWPSGSKWSLKDFSFFLEDQCPGESMDPQKEQYSRKLIGDEITKN